MDANTRFLIERMDDHKRELTAQIAETKKDLSEKIDILWAFRLKILGASMIISAIGSMAMTAAVEYIRR